MTSEQKKKLTFTTLFSYKPWAASPLQCSDLLMGNLEGGPDQGPVAGENSAQSVISTTYYYSFMQQHTKAQTLSNCDILFVRFFFGGGGGTIVAFLDSGQ